jgi:CelD/BcsL family acetyltransferase involved in cellulose biosynthesis
MELERCWRVLNREPGVSFEWIVDEAMGLETLATMDRQQRERLTEMGADFSLDEPAQAAFYRDRLGERLRSGAVVITALRAGDDLIGALYAVAHGPSVVVLRICNAGKAWAKASPGRLILHKSIEAFCKRGFEVCDLSIGDYDYKRRFGTVRMPLVDFVGAMTLRGQLAAARHWAVATLRTYPQLDASVRRLADRAKSSRRPAKGA